MTALLLLVYLSDTPRVLLSCVLAAARCRSTISQLYACHWLPVEFRYGGCVNHVDSGKLHILSLGCVTLIEYLGR